MNSTDIQLVKAEVEQFPISDEKTLEEYRLKFLVRKGIVSELFEAFKSEALPKDERAALGKLLNDLKKTAEGKFSEYKAKLAEQEVSVDYVDYFLPGMPSFVGKSHPVQKMLHQMTSIFQKMDFEISTGPELEKDQYNFSMLNFPPNHPARDMQDTLFVKKTETIKDDVLLRTHTSPVQVRALLNQRPPVRVIAPGKVYRNEAVSARSLCVFHQVEGIYVDKDVSFRDLKGTLYAFVHQLFGSNTRIRFRPSFFPFTEPSAEMDITCYICGGKGCRICKKTGWLEILGCGMMHPNVLKACNLNPAVYSGFAFGMGVERSALLRYQLTDIRSFYENDFRLLSQFSR